MRYRLTEQTTQKSNKIHNVRLIVDHQTIYLIKKRCLNRLSLEEREKKKKKSLAEERFTREITLKTVFSLRQHFHRLKTPGPRFDSEMLGCLAEVFNLALLQVEYIPRLSNQHYFGWNTYQSFKQTSLQEKYIPRVSN